MKNIVGSKNVCLKERLSEFTGVISNKPFIASVEYQQAEASCRSQWGVRMTQILISLFSRYLSNNDYFIIIIRDDDIDKTEHLVKLSSEKWNLFGFSKFIKRFF